jgi:hypothetical protein
MRKQHRSPPPQLDQLQAAADHCLLRWRSVLWNAQSWSMQKSMIGLTTARLTRGGSPRPLTRRSAGQRPASAPQGRADNDSPQPAWVATATASMSAGFSAPGRLAGPGRRIGRRHGRGALLRRVASPAGPARAQVDGGRKPDIAARMPLADRSRRLQLAASSTRLL